MLADRLAHYTQSLRFKDLPGDVVHEVKRRILDSLGCAFGAWTATPCRIAREMALAVKVPGGATVWGTNHKTLPDLATFANGAMVRYLDFNDTYLSKEPAHPSDNIAAVLAAGETAHASGELIIQALTLSYEIQCRLCDAAALRPRGWDHVTYGPLSSALGIANVLKLTDAQTRQAVNLAGVANVALRQTRVGDLSMWKACAFSNAARNGMFAALLARRGMTGPAPIFEGEKGFMKLVSGPFELPMLGGEAMPGGEPVPFKILKTCIKHFPVEYHAQSAVEAALALRAELLATEGKTWINKVADVEIGSYDVAIEIIGRDPEKWQPATRETADHSFPYCVAVALLDGRVSMNSFSPKRLRDPRLHELMKKIHVVKLADLEHRYPTTMPTRLTIRTSQGSTHSRQVDQPLGHPGHPLSDQEVGDKLRRLTSRRIDRAQLDRLLAFVWHLEDQTDIGAFMPLLRVRS
ncbi:MAG TPA: MmgE/PrpD family protein [Nitrospira sp.]|nr:MmgE/PrpD family protein [Nitrospira sp.]HNG53074.1 MmgE/PrpD family protein [Nitrospira sp.]